jgi:hypothetical protein
MATGTSGNEVLVRLEDRGELTHGDRPVECFFSVTSEKTNLMRSVWNLGKLRVLWDHPDITTGIPDTSKLARK